MLTLTICVEIAAHIWYNRCKYKRKGSAALTQEKIDRINVLARKSRTSEGLTPEEKEEQTALRNEFRAAMKANLTAQLDRIEFVDEPKGGVQNG